MAKDNPPCPICGANAKVKETRLGKVCNDAFFKPREYACEGPDSHSFWTHEVHESPAFYVIKKTTVFTPPQREPFSIQKLTNSLLGSAPSHCTPEQCLIIATRISKHFDNELTTLRSRKRDAIKEITSQNIGERVLYELSRENNANGWWIRYAIKFFALDSKYGGQNFAAYLETLRDLRSKADGYIKKYNGIN